MQFIIHASTRYVAGGAMAVAGSVVTSSSGNDVVAPAPLWRPSLTLYNVTFTENGSGCFGGAVYAHDVDGFVTEACVLEGNVVARSFRGNLVFVFCL